MRRSSNTDSHDRRQPAISITNGRIYFSRHLERRFFFVLTLAMLGWGIMVRLGII